MNFIEIFLFILAGQYIHVLIKMKSAKKQFGTAFKAGIFFAENKLNLIINGSLILIFTAMLSRAGFGTALGSAMATAKPLSLFGISVPAETWIGLACYSAFLTAGYFIQSLFYWMMKGGLKKANIEQTEEEKTP
jgi:hypothetical protein